MSRNEIDDDRLRFFLERRTLIQEWARAGDAEPAEAAAFLRSLEEDLQPLAAERSADVVTHVTGTETHLGLARPRWDASDYPQAIIGLGWGKTVRFEGASDAVWIGLRVRQSGEFHGAYLQIQQAVAALGKDPLFKSRSAAGNWIEYGYFPCTRPAYWNDLSGYRSDLLDAVAAAWARYDPVIQQVLGGPPLAPA